MKNSWIAALAICVIGGLELFALSRGINGTLMTTSIALIAGIAGYEAKKKLG